MCVCAHNKKLRFLNETYWVIVYLRAQAINVEDFRGSLGAKGKKINIRYINIQFSFILPKIDSEPVV